MKIMDFLRRALSEDCADSKKANAIEKLYCCQLKNEARKIAAHLDETVFFENEGFLRLLSFSEVCDASEDLNVDFQAVRVLPLFDLGDNDYIAYRMDENKWCRFNIAEELSFSTKASIIEFFI